MATPLEKLEVLTWTLYVLNTCSTTKFNAVQYYVQLADIKQQVINQISGLLAGEL